MSDENADLKHDTSPFTAVCPHCGTTVVPGDKFCEACGADLPLLAPKTIVHETPPFEMPAISLEPCVGCGAPASEISPDRYCQRCGLRQPDNAAHREIDLGLIAGVSDIGLRHHDNEDAMALAEVAPGRWVAVVCDGVSSTVHPGAAAQAAADAACTVLSEAVKASPEGGPVDNYRAALVDAAAQAQQAILDLRPDQEALEAGNSASCTFVAAVVDEEHLSVGWLGDSRAYWFGEGDDPVRLTTDDSWAAQAVAAGLMSEAEAEADDRAHAIVRWLGADAVDVVPSVITAELSGTGRVMVCSDGLWNYASEAHELAVHLEGAPKGSTNLQACQHLVRFARGEGGHDNITVILVSVTPPPPQSKHEAPTKRMGS